MKEDVAQLRAAMDRVDPDLIRSYLLSVLSCTDQDIRAFGAGMAMTGSTNDDLRSLRDQNNNAYRGRIYPYPDGKLIKDAGEGDVRAWMAYMGELYLAGSLDPEMVESVTRLMEADAEAQWLHRPITVAADVADGSLGVRGVRATCALLQFENERYEKDEAIMQLGLEKLLARAEGAEAELLETKRD